VQLISYNESVWSGAINETVVQPPIPAGSPPFPAGSPPSGGDGSPSGLTYGERVAVIVVSVVGGLILLAVLAFLVYVLIRRKRKTWAPAKGEFDGAVTAGAAQQQDPAEDVVLEGQQGADAAELGTPSTILRTPAGDDGAGTSSPPLSTPSRLQETTSSTPTRSAQWNVNASSQEQV